MIKIRLGTLISKYILKMVSAEWAAIFPLRIASVIPFANRQPVISAHGLSRPAVILFEPWNHERRFRLELAVRDIVVRQRTVERILLGNESYMNVIPARAWFRIVSLIIISRPIQVQ